MIPSIGRTVIYTLTEQDADAINRRRKDAARNLGKIREDAIGYVAHVGNNVAEGDRFPMVIVRVWAGLTAPTEQTSVNGTVLLDGTDTYWATSRQQGDGVGQWHEPVRVG